MLNEYKEKIMNFYQSKRHMPTYKDMMDMFGFKSKNAVFKLVNKLVEAGIVAKDSLGRIIPTTLSSELPMLGSVKAGFPSAVEAEITDSINLDDLLIENKGSTYMLEVDGDSMIDAHIEDGDLVIAEKTTKVKDGDIVIAEVDGEWTMKYFRDRGGKIFLEPANKKYKDIYPMYSLRIAAKVKCVIRKY